MNKHLHYRGPRKTREKRAENLFEEIIAEKFSNLEKETDIQLQEAQRVSNKMNSRRFTSSYIKRQRLNIKREF